jgi:hypothetical protein
MEDRHAKMIERIYNEVVGDEYTEGLIPKVNKIEKDVYNLNVKYKIVIGVIAFLIGASAFLSDISKLF